MQRRIGHTSRDPLIKRANVFMVLLLLMLLLTSYLAYQENIRHMFAPLSAFIVVLYLYLVTMPKINYVEEGFIRETQYQSEKLAAIGSLSNTVAHQIRNPLNNISSSIYLLKDLLSDKNPKIQEHITDIESELNRADKIINNFLNFSRPSKEIVEEDVHLIINQTLDLIRETAIAQGIDIKREFTPNLPKITMDVDQMKEVFLNIVLNAQEAMAKGGCLTTTTNLNKNYIHIAFADTGIGIPEEKTGQVFDPYYTTKAKGMGLGLFIAQMIIETHHGSIDIESKTGEGTTVKINLPLPINKRGEFDACSK